ncbi:LPXTG cell wall anchor domain-containing protein, partial [Streptococcus suis]|uniref:LPXTG cell wall anchor domain-containing protein n=1 Tax=Streptococcus suis TaxID=1307 RepID=UPI0005B379ED
KRSSRKKRLAKWSKLGLSLAAVTVLGGLVEPVDVPLLSNCTVEAQELTNQSGGEQALPADTATVTIELETTGVEELVGASYRYQRIRGFERLEIHLQPGETYTLPTYDGYKLINFKSLNEVTDIAPEDAVLSYADFTPGQRVRLYYDYLMTDQVYDVVTKQYVDRETVIPSTTPSINSPTDTPPAQPTENPVDQSITIKAVYTEEQIEPGQKVDVLKEIEYTLKPGESVVLEPLAFEGWTSRVVQESQTVTYEGAKARPNKEYYFYYIEEGTTPTEKPVETPAEKQVISSEVKILNLDGSTYWKGEGLDKAVVGTTTVELEVGGDLTIPATVVPEGYEITDVRFNVLSTGVKELPHTWTYEEYKNYTSAPMSVPEIDILVKPVSSPATPVTPPAETPSVESSAGQSVNPPTSPVQPSTSQTTKPVSKETTPIVNEELEPSKVASLDSYKDVTEASSSVNVRVHGQDMGKVISLSVTKENDPSVFAKLPQGLTEHQVDLYDIKTLDTRGQFVQITEEATVTLPVVAGKEIEKVIYFLASTGAVEELPFTVDKANNQVSFTVSHFSHYGIVYQASKPVSQVQPGSVSQSVQPVVAPSIQSNQTGSSSHTQTKQSTVKPASTSQSQAKTLPATGEASSVLHLTGLGLLGLAGLVVKRRSGKSS